MAAPIPGIGPGEVAPQIFEKYVVDKDHQFVKIGWDGTPEGASRPLADVGGDFFRGSLAFIEDTKTRSFVSWVITVWQKFHSLVSGREQIPEAAIGHAAVILHAGHPDPTLADHHPFQIAHAYITGIQAIDKDYLKEKDVTRLIIYRPTDPRMREECALRAEETAVHFGGPHDPQGVTLPVLKRNPYSLWDAITSIFHHKKHEVCQPEVNLTSPEIKQRTAGLLADCFLGYPLLKENGRLEGRFCSAYVLAVLQGVWVKQAIKDLKFQGVLTDENIDHFVKDPTGTRFCTREELVDKIVEAFDRPVGAVQQAIYGIYHTHKIIRVDSRYTLPHYAARGLDRLAGVFHEHVPPPPPPPPDCPDPWYRPRF